MMMMIEEGHKDEGHEPQVKKKRRKRLRRRKKGIENEASNVEGSMVGVVGVGGETVGAAATTTTTTTIRGDGGRERVKVTIDAVPDVALLRVVDMLGTPPRDTEDVFNPSYPESLRDLGSMAAVCHRWNKVVGCSGVWKEVCKWRWPWMQSEDKQLVDSLTAKDTTRRMSHGGDVGHHESSMYRDLCLQMGRCLRVAGVSRWGSGGTVIAEDYTMMVEVYLEGSGKRLVSEIGPPILSYIGVGDDDEKLLINCGAGWAPRRRSKHWDVAQILGVPGVDVTEVKEALAHERISVEVMLVDNRTKKKAMLLK